MQIYTSYFIYFLTKSSSIAFFEPIGGGDIDFNEFRKAFQFADPKGTYEQAYALFKTIDVDDGGTIDFDEFCHGMEMRDSEERYYASFSLILSFVFSIVYSITKKKKNLTLTLTLT